VRVDLPRTTLRHGDGRCLFVYGEHGPTTALSAGDGPPHGLHLRHDALTDTWIGVSPARNTRPLTTGAENVSGSASAALNSAEPPPSCPLCPGGPEVPFPYTAATFENRFPSLVLDPPAAPHLEGATAPSAGRCEVVLYTSQHTGSLASLSPVRLASVIAIWADRSQELWQDPEIAHVMVFENRGDAVGATIDHPHGQIYAFDRLPPLTRDRVATLRAHRDTHDRCLSCSVVALDQAAEGRHVLENDSFTVTIPFAARWPYEVHVRARRHGLGRLHQMTADERRDLAHALRGVVTAYDALYERPLPYMMTVMEAPNDDAGAVQDWHLAFEFLPPNRAVDRMKVRASVETATGFFINDTVPERTAHDLIAALAAAGGAPELPVVDIVIEHLPEGAAIAPPGQRRPLG
jgi:UDPglucose--hexose-1-phosphate uridylyltransferase